ncbi:hypothetical protein CCACVL1_22118 [Corchorus capsularis]|uniref:Beta-carotene isomerase D27-like C-terminal domain-containing protein n=1 Tax=Corchorus capsularis TaxID=210143 RepID=A0A1R3H103_COCAP|nr:hypothetical protein CCACVL1_22118 [Corchorus capsularis]
MKPLAMALLGPALPQAIVFSCSNSNYLPPSQSKSQLQKRSFSRVFCSSVPSKTVRILNSIFPPFLLELYKILIAPIDGGKVAAMMVARVTVLTCQWLMGTCTVNSVDLPDGTSCNSGVFVERCKYLEESKCVGVCINTCKLPTQSFFKDYMGVPLVMEPNFSDYSCQFKFGVLPPLPENDAALKEPCLDICPIANKRREVQRNVDGMKCPRA